MEKIKITEGVYWIAIPQADLRILCGSPADVVKHLMRMGLIAKRETGKFSYETGPNAILLADTPSQNGEFCNLAEFPILQMFYRQGLIIPGHPNNKGQKPILMGSALQINAQLEYIDIGKYGIVDPKELKLYLNEKEANELLNLKIRFAFGKIEPITNLIDTVIIEKEPVTIQEKVTIARKELNIFEISYGHEKEEVNLNLPHLSTYDSAVHLDYHSIEREYFSVIHVGEGDGWDPYRPCMGSMISYQGKLYLIDAGPNILKSLTALGISISEIEGVFQTHAHDDHFAGIPSLARADHKIKFFATPIVRASIMKKASALMGVSLQQFESYFDPIDLNTGVWNDIDGLEVMPIPSPHPIETTAFYFRVFWEGGYKTYAHLADIIALDTLQDLINKSSGKLDTSLYEQTKSSYLMFADVKKIDAGGGMIHGSVLDFEQDDSTKILIAHKSEPLTDKEREIGSDAVFGSQDVLIPATQDYSMRNAAQFLAMYFPGSTDSERAALLNCPVASYNAGEILIKRGEPTKKIFLLLNGVVAIIDTHSQKHLLASAGTLIGEQSVLTGKLADSTFRAASYVKALSIPAELYLRFIAKNFSVDEEISFQKKIAALRASPLFGDMIPSTVISKIARSMKHFTVKAGEYVQLNGAELVVIEQGEARVFFDTVEIETIRAGGVFGEESVLLKTATMTSCIAQTDLFASRIPAEAITNIPIIEWKILEIYERRLMAFGICFTNQ
ncbi:MAG TPA: cyclic nucleotide-binding domain-containing protein [Spirochaetia bacterium]|nr:cyclic nucleotide-binding domain-containing protein [Spirochaetales bacterium]HRS64675.1 cyclic nucleotide-binding domain-containing protein [Spirochaetia bacterium]HRV27372.1 cyclic nucleotide-binding domain-containing protein [Spirochaetia bacterium]